MLKLSSSACRSSNIDLVLLIDGSKSVRPQNFELVKKFVNQVTVLETWVWVWVEDMKTPLLPQLL